MTSKTPFESYSYHQKLSDELRELQQLEMYVLADELRDTLEPCKLTTELIVIILQMMMELNEYRRKNKTTDKVLASEKRLKKLLDIATGLDKITSNLHGFKVTNRYLLAKNLLLNKEKAELKRQLDNLTNADNF